MRAELKLAHSAQRGDRAADDVRDLSAVRAVYATVRIGEVDVVEEVAGVRLDGEFQLDCPLTPQVF